jgi:hypothetical protein
MDPESHVKVFVEGMQGCPQLRAITVISLAYL